jgi:hypothetical protein
MGVGCVNFGIETVSPKLLSFLNKKQTREDCYKAMRICQDFGLIRKVNLMFGIPTQDQEDYEYSLQFVKETKPEIRSCFFFAPLPGCELYDYCFDNSYLPNSYDRNRFDWFEPEVDGLSNIQIKLAGIDYDLATQYVKKIDKVMNYDKALFERMKIVDSYPWVLVGTTRHYYYKILIKKLSSFHWKNCCGFIDVDTEACFQLEDDNSKLMPKYNNRTNTVPFWCITHSFLGSDYKVIERYVHNQFGSDIPVISISSFRKSHSVADINRFMEKKAVDRNKCHV